MSDLSSLSFRIVMRLMRHVICYIPLVVMVLSELTFWVMINAVDRVAGEGRVHLAYISCAQFSSEGRQSRNSIKQGRSWSRGHGGELLTGLLLLAYSVCFLILPRTTCRGMAPPTVSWPCPHQSLTKKISHKPVWLRHFLNWGFSRSQITLSWIRLTNKQTN